MFNELYQSASDELKLQFLDEVLKKDGTLQLRFVEFCKNTGAVTETEEEAPHTMIEEAKAELQQELEHLDFEGIDLEFEEYNPHLPEYEIMDQLAEKKVQEEFDIFKSELQNDLAAGKVDRFYLSLAGAYEAAMETRLQNTPETEIIDPLWMLETIEQLWQDLKNDVEINLITPYHFERIVSGLFERHYYYHHSENRIAFTEDGRRIALIDNQPFLYFFDTYLLKALDTREKADQLEHLANHWQIPRNIIPRLTLRMRELQGDTDAWEKAAQFLFLENEAVARELLTYYEKSAPDKFLRVAHQIWQQPYFRNEFAPYLHQTLTYQDAPQLYKNVVRYLTQQNQSEEYYLEFRKLHNREEIEAFIGEHRNAHTFFIMMMRIEQEYDKMLKHIENNMDSMKFNAMIQQVITDKPRESFSLIERKIRKTLENKRGRSVYEELTELLQLAGNIPQLRDQAKILAQEMFDWQPRLPALREMLKQKQLV